MSNCINIVYKNMVHLNASEVDVNGLRSLIMKAEKEVNANSSVDEEIPAELKLAWWFLSKNTIFKNTGGVDIRFGAGRSGHTWRDFKGTLWTLKNFIKCPVWIRFGITDEYDGHQTIERVSVNLQEGLK